jgi:DNA-binding response OmpR family regulator
MGKILVVDDDPATTRLLELILSQEGYEVITVNDAREALPTALVHDPSLVLLDLMMPSMDGVSVCKDLRAELQFAHLPIVFFTSASDIENKVLAFGSGGNDYVVKPIHPQELKLRVKAWVGNGQGNGNPGGK